MEPVAPRRPVVEPSPVPALAPEPAVAKVDVAKVDVAPVREAAAVEAEGVTSGDTKAVWARVREIGSERGPSVRVLIDALELKELGTGSATVVVRSAGKLGHAKRERARLGELIGEAMGRGAVEVKVEAGARTESVAPATRTRLTSEQEQQAMQNPLVRKAVELFDARVVAVREGVSGGAGQEQ